MRAIAGVAAAAAAARAACPGQNLLPNPADPGEWGPWPVSARTINGTLTSRGLVTEVWYPAVPGSERGAEPYWYSHRDQHLPADQRSKIPDCDPLSPGPARPQCCQPRQAFDRIWFDLPLDEEHGPYPLIVFIHGFSAWRQYFLHLVEHWASRGFVVVAADYPGINLQDTLTRMELKPVPQADEAGDTELLLAELATLADDRLAFLRGRIDASNLGLTGHSAGGGATGSLSAARGRVAVPMAGGGTRPRAGGQRYSTLVIGGQNDTGGARKDAYDASPAPKRYLAGANMGHETYSDLCWMAAPQGSISGIGASCGVVGSKLLEPLGDQGCRFAKTGTRNERAADMATPEAAWALMRYVTSGVFEETLMCDTRMKGELDSLPSRFNSSVLAGYEQEL